MHRSAHSRRQSPRCRRGAVRAALGLLSLLGALVAGGADAVPNEVTEAGLKAAFLFKFTQYAEWPAEALGPAGSPIRMCVLERDSLAEVLAQAIQGRTSRDRPLVVRRVQSAQEARGCHVLFVGSAGPRPVEALLAPLASEPTLTVGDAEGFAHNGGMIHLAKRGTRLHFEINRRAVERAGLQLSSQLLKLARLIDGPVGAAE